MGKIKQNEEMNSNRIPKVYSWAASPVLFFFFFLTSALFSTVRVQLPLILFP